MSSTEAKDLRNYSKEELSAHVADLRRELVTLRAKKANIKSGEIRRVRKCIARALTIATESARAAAKEEWAGKAHIPKDLRERKTRALRRQLKPEEANARRARTIRKLRAFPKKLYAVRA